MLTVIDGDESSPGSNAAKYRIETREGAFTLVEKDSPWQTRKLRRARVEIKFTATPTLVGNELSNIDSGGRRWLTLDLTEIQIGYEGDGSDVANNAIFVISGAELRHVALNCCHCQVVSLTEFHKRRATIREITSGQNRETQSSTEDEPGLFAVAVLADVPSQDVLDDAREYLTLIVGLPDYHFNDVVEACLAERVQRIQFEGILDGLTTAHTNQVARDLLLRANQSIEFAVDDLRMIRLLTRPDENAVVDEVVEPAEVVGPLVEVIAEPVEVVDEQAEEVDEQPEQAGRQSWGASGSILFLTALFCFAANAFGASSAAVIAAAVLGSAATVRVALRTLDRSITRQIDIIGVDVRRASESRDLPQTENQVVVRRKR
jgi:hypothetical protein